MKANANTRFAAKLIVELGCGYRIDKTDWAIADPKKDKRASFQ
jgi:hypothetical protein